ncbi:MAG: serine hydrolase [Candidatus Nealsonbacteria bacterium]|nr:serine hydrolase [Candidatus Nealsonbacteria bacterium]
MKGFPPAKERRVSLENWAESGAYVRYAQQNAEVVFKTLPIERGSEPAWILPRKMIEKDDFEQAQVLWGPSVTSGERISVAQWLDRSESDALVVMHDGHVVAEHYWGDMCSQTRHHLMCGAKSILGTILAPYFLERRLDYDAPVTKYVPELAKTGFKGAKIRHLMDQTISLDYEEKWDSGDNEWTWGTREFREAKHLMGQCMRISGLFPPLPNEHNVGLQDYLFTLAKGEREHGEHCSYKDANPMALQLILERLTGKSYSQHLTDFWQRLHPEGMATLSVDNIGMPYFTGLSCTARDWARWGEMVRCHGRVNGRHVFPGIRELVEDIRREPGLRDSSSISSVMPNTGYRNQFWTASVVPGKKPLLMANGLYLQVCLIDCDRRNVVVWMGSFWDFDPDKKQKKHTASNAVVGLWSFVNDVLPQLVT